MEYGSCPDPNCGGAMFSSSLLEYDENSGEARFLWLVISKECVKCGASIIVRIPQYSVKMTYKRR